jgi:hypothetical protein
MKDYDIVQELVMGIYKRGRQGAHTTLVKVHRHTEEPLHAVADAMATEGADRKMEDEERPLYEMPQTSKLTFLFKGGNSGRETKGQWSPKIKARIREHEAELLWAKRSTGMWTEKFHKREGVGRKELGEAIQRCEDWAVTGWIRSLTPHYYLVASTYKKWRIRVDDTCLCGEGAVLVGCGLKSFRRNQVSLLIAAALSVKMTRSFSICANSTACTIAVNSALVLDKVPANLLLGCCLPLMS